MAYTIFSFVFFNNTLLMAGIMYLSAKEAPDAPITEVLYWCICNARSFIMFIMVSSFFSSSSPPIY